MLEKKTTKIFICCLIFASMTLPALADNENQAKVFFVDQDYDKTDRESVSSTLKKVSENGYFYIENDWYSGLEEAEKTQVDESLLSLADDFDNNIYSSLTAVFGSIWVPGIDSDDHVTILFHQTKQGVAGYFRNEDEYPKLQSQESNEREMVYLNTEYLKSPLIKSFLSHELVHLITFNQKERLKGIQEDTWLNEARAEYAPTLLDYDKEYQHSNLQQRIKDFVKSPSDSLTDWQGLRNDYGVISAFIHYLSDQYGHKVIASSFNSENIGIDSINDALLSWSYEETFSDIFTDWTIASLVNNCEVNERFCYKNENLSNLRVAPSLIFLPSTYKTEVSLDYEVKPWSGRWYRVIGGEGDLKVVFSGKDNVLYKVPYVICQKENGCEVGYIELDTNQYGEISFSNFNQTYSSLTLIPSVQPQEKTLDFNDHEPSFSFNLLVSSTDKEKEIEYLLRVIQELKQKILQTQNQINNLLSQKPCSGFDIDLYLGQRNEQVRCLQVFLSSQADIYPESYITGYFGFLTQKATIRFQEKYKQEILLPYNLLSGTGYVGSLTRQKINSLLSFE